MLLRRVLLGAAGTLLAVAAWNPTGARLVWVSAAILLATAAPPSTTRDAPLPGPLPKVRERSTPSGMTGDIRTASPEGAAASSLPGVPSFVGAKVSPFAASNADPVAGVAGGGLTSPSPP